MARWRVANPEQNSATAARWRKKNPEKHSANGVRWRKANRDKRSATDARWRKANRDKILAYAARWRRANPERVAAHSARRYQNNKDDARARVAKRKAAKLHRTPPWLTRDHYDQIREMYVRAAYLGALLGTPYHVDHIVPLQGANVSGLHVPWNLQLLPAVENLQKKNRVDVECAK